MTGTVSSQGVPFTVVGSQGVPFTVVGIITTLLCVGGLWLTLTTLDTDPPAAVDTTEHIFVICLNGQDQLYAAIVAEAWSQHSYTVVVEPSGLRRTIINAVCVTTVGTLAQLEEAQAEAGHAPAEAQ